MKEIRFEILKTKNKLKRTTRHTRDNRIMRERLRNKIQELEQKLK